MKGQFSINLLKKTASLALVASASVLLCLPALAQSNINNDSNRMENSGQGNDTNITPRNTSPEVNREQDRPGTGSDGETRQNLTDESDNNNRIMQNRTGSPNSPGQSSPSGTTNDTNNQMRQNRTGGQNSPSGNTNSDNNNRIMQNRTGGQTSPSGNTNSNYENSDTVIPNNTGNQNSPSDNTNYDNNNRMNNTGTYDNDDTGAVRGMW